MDVSHALRAARLLALAGLAALLWFVLSLFLGSSSASADEPSPLDPLGSVVGSVTEPLVSTVAPVVSAPVQAVAPVVQAVAPVAAQAITAVVPAPVAAAVAPVAAPVAAVVSTVTTPVTTAIAPITAPLDPLVSAVVTPLAPSVAQIVEPLAPIVSPVVDPLLPTVGSLLDQVAEPVFGPAPQSDGAAVGVAVSVPTTDATPTTTAAGAALRLTSSGYPATSAGLIVPATTNAPVGAPGLPVDGPLPAAPTALSGSAAGSAAGGTAASADVARVFSLAAAWGASVTTRFDDELPSSPTFPSDTTPD
ncbi:MAG: hypothetical protein ABWX92_11000 [Mycetocola sp.]